MADHLSSPDAKSAIVIVPGSFTIASFYHQVVDKLRENGYETIVDTLPSSSRAPPEEPATMYDDAAHFHHIIEQLADQGKDVVVVAHSYGGIVGTEASSGLSKTDRKKAGKQGGIVKLVYLTSIVPPVGKSAQDVTGGGDVTFIAVEGAFMKCIPEGTAPFTFSDLPFEQGVELAKQSPYQAIPSFTGKLTYAAYKEIPASYIVCENDMIIRPDAQWSYIATIEKEGGKPVQVHTLKTGHCPNASAPDDLVKTIIASVAGT